MTVQKKSYKDFILVIGADESKEFAKVKACFKVPASENSNAEVLTVTEKNAEALFNKEHDSGRQAIAVFFVRPKKPNIRLIKTLAHKNPLIKIIFLAQPAKEGELSGALSGYALMGIDYGVVKCEPASVSLAVKNILRSNSLKKRERTALQGDAINISSVPSKQDPIEYQQLITKDQYLKAILPVMNIATIVTDPKGKIKVWNKKACEFLSTREQEALGSQIYDIKIGNWPTIAERIKTEISQSHNHTVNLEAELVFSNQEKDFYADIFSSAIKNNNGDLIGTLFLLEDVTHKKEVDKAKTEFVSLASHQLRTPMTGIKWILQKTLGRKKELTKWQKEFLPDALTLTKRMIILVNDLLNISRLETGLLPVYPQKIELNEFVKNIIRESKAVAMEKNQKIKLVSTGKSIKINLDKQLITQIIGNLLSNAMRYSEPKTHVLVGLKKKGNNAIISVADKGIGISREDQKKLFTRFFRSEKASKYSSKGSGLGLYMISRILAICNGKIDVKSTVGKGSVFTMTLPLKGPKAKKGLKPFMPHKIS